MLINEYALYEDHKMNHLALVNRVEDFVQDLLNGEPILIFEILIFMKEWLMEHILEEDMVLAGIFNRTV